MEESKINLLYVQIKNISAEYLIHQKRNNVERIKELIPQIQEFVVWYMEANHLQLEEELYVASCKELLVVLQDILTSLQEEDKVLLHDAVCYGLSEYLECFIPEHTEE